jgi:multicomponent Na+:H+ antiporter subunit C
MNLEQFLGLYNYWIVIFLMMTGFYIVIARENLIKTIIGLNIFQASVFLLYITMGKVDGGTAPIIVHGTEHNSSLQAAAEQVGEEATHVAEHTSEVIYSNALPSVLMLTAIVVGIATTAMALALIVRIREDYGTVEEDEILRLDRES